MGKGVCVVLNMGSVHVAAEIHLRQINYHIRWDFPKSHVV